MIPINKPDSIGADYVLRGPRRDTNPGHCLWKRSCQTPWEVIKSETSVAQPFLYEK